MAIRIQRQVGGSLADVLKTVANTLREREQLRRTVRALSADGRLSAWIVGLAPFFVAMFLVIFNPDYVRPLFQDVLGWIMSGFALVMIAIGVFIITRIIKVEI
jgi:tight adherence protein B